MGHGGDDPPFQIRRVLHRRAERLMTRDPHDRPAVTLAALRTVHRTPAVTQLTELKAVRSALERAISLLEHEGDK